MDIVLTGTIFACVFIAVLILALARGGGNEQKEMLAQRMMRPEEDDDGLNVDITRKLRKQEQSPLMTVLRQFNFLRNLEENMWQAGIYWRVSDVLLLIVLLFGAGWAGGEAFWADGYFATGSGIALAAVPVAYIRFARKRRLKNFGSQLPFALDLIKSSLEAGHSLQRALQVLVGEFADPLGGEFRTVLEQTRIGLPLARALEDLLKRVPEDDLKLLVVAVKVQTEVGSSLATIVGRLSEIVRLRQRLRLQIKALTAQSRMGGMVVGLLPILVLAAFSLIQPGYTDSLFYDPTGQTILKAAVGFDLMAILTIRRLLRVDY
ncbi:MAG TPA: type II secretion system F family protein [Candidatus Binataceae bacterium]|nr:type II secretion system F family protein [Candidatus Binataceae bacterium]